MLVIVVLLTDFSDVFFLKNFAIAEFYNDER